LPKKAKVGWMISQGLWQYLRPGWQIALLALVVCFLLSGKALGLHGGEKGRPHERRPNRLIQETSPYLRQHAYNPVDWHPWGKEALERSRRENKPIFLSIGYSTCHWCHVMAQESFENPEIANILNQHFICIKVDREERPDLDDTYMQAAIMLTGQGGWPLTVFLTPDLKPFFAGTYFPPKVFSQLLQDLIQAYRQNPKGVAETAQELTQAVQALGKVRAPGQEPQREVLAQAFRRLQETFDPQHGGFGKAPKFPEAVDLSFLLHYHRFAGEPKALDMAGVTLEKMARGGIYDQLGGGFHRYATDDKWLAPHFEKMLYDNALLPQVYLIHYQLTGSTQSKRIARETLNFAVRELGAPQGGFFSALDAQSEDKEGKYYLWSKAEVERAVGKKAAPLVSAALGITAAGNFEGANILTRPLTEAELAARFSMSPKQVRRALDAARKRLWEARDRRVRPARNDKIITAWNGLMISALAKGAQVLGDRKYYHTAAQAARFLLHNLIKEDRLQRIWTRGQASVPGFLEDYAFLAAGLLDLFETDFDPQWLVAGQRLQEQMEGLFLDAPQGVYFAVGRDQETPLVRAQSIYDRAMPSGNSMAALVCLKLHRFTGEDRFYKRAHAIISRFQGQARKVPLGFPQLLAVQTLYLTPSLELTVVGQPQAQKTQELLKEMYRRFLPERRLVLKNPQDAAGMEKLVPGVQYYTLKEGQPAAYICRNQTCLPPIASLAKLAAHLARFGSTISPSPRHPAAGIP
jgi:uncharacterized protein YyaL (SSP411 family)